MGYQFGPRVLSTSSKSKDTPGTNFYIVLMDLPSDWQVPDETIAPSITDENGNKIMSIDYGAMPPEALSQDKANAYKTCLMKGYVYEGIFSAVNVKVPVENGKATVPSNGHINTTHSKESHIKGAQALAAAPTYQDFQCRVHKIMNSSNGRIDFFTVAADVPAGYSSKLMPSGISGDGKLAFTTSADASSTKPQTAFGVCGMTWRDIAVSRVHIIDHSTGTSKDTLGANVTGEVDSSTWQL